jgi:hypothetical protein
MDSILTNLEQTRVPYGWGVYDHHSVILTLPGLISSLHVSIDCWTVILSGQTLCNLFGSVEHEQCRVIAKPWIVCSYQRYYTYITMTGWTSTLVKVIIWLVEL